MATPRHEGKQSRPTCMGTAEFNRILERLNLQDYRGELAGEFLGLHERTIRRLKTGVSPIDARTAMLLRLMSNYRMPVAKVSRLKEFRS